MKILKSSIFFFLALCSLHSWAYLKQRTFYQVDDGGVESFVHWHPKKKVKVNIHQFEGNLNDTEISFNDVLPAIDAGIKQWTHSLLNGLTLNLNFNLNNGQPFATNDNCETLGNGQPDGKNNIIFSSKMDESCGKSIARGEGIIGLTRVLFDVTSGEIVEADMQFNDKDYDFTLSGLNQLGSASKIVNLKDVFTHEFGHFLGLDHSDFRQATMIYSAADGLSTTSTDDQLGVVSLYGVKEETQFSTLRGSVVNENAEPYFGISVYIIDADSMKVLSTQITDLNGAFQACQIPSGNYLAFVDRFRPNSRGVRVHSYYAGDGHGNPMTDENDKCYNPGCKLMNKSLEPFWLSGADKEKPEIFTVSENGGAQYLNIRRPYDAPTVQQLNHIQENLKEGVALAHHMVANDLPQLGNNSLGSDEYRMNLRGGDDYSIQTLSLALNSRLALSLQLKNEAGEDVTSELCQNNEVNVREAIDPTLNCHIQNSGVYQLIVEGKAVSCSDVPGNGRGITCTDVQSSSKSHYLVKLTNKSDLDSLSVASLSLDTQSNASKEWDLLPSCNKLTYDTRKNSRGGGGGCGAIVPLSNEDNFWTQLFALVINLPILWVLLALILRKIFLIYRKKVIK